MGRPVKMRQELKDTGVLTNYANEEVARLSENGLLIVNEQQLFFSIIRGANKYGGRCPCTQLFKTYGLTGGWAADTGVMMALRHLQELKTIDLVFDEDGKIKFAVPLMLPQLAMTKIPRYHTREEVLAGLFPVDNEEVL